ncbi:aspartyl protease family protein [Phenylobacterium sp.]|uniref:aspartyl protease family protein n=1 Tax=Phenylobacterium sp. TaxID=1871053 RepID=UPI0035B1D750
MPRVTAALLALALALAPAARAQPQPQAPVAAAVHATPFDFLQDRQILFPVTLNGRVVEAWLDSGASATVVDAALAAELGVLGGGAASVHGLASEVQGVRLAVADLQLGDLVMHGRRVAIMDLTPLTRVTPRPAQLILGRDVFEATVVDIDFQARRIAFLDPTAFAPPDAPHLPLAASGELRSFPVAVAGETVAAILDLGNSGALLIRRDWAEARGLLSGRPVSTQLSVGVDGPLESAVTSLDGIEVGGVRFDGAPTVATPGLMSAAPVNVGLGLLSRFRVTVDFTGGRLWLQPYPGAARAPFRKNRAGLWTVNEGDRLRVTHVAPGSPAAAAGWRVGSAITAIDGQPITPGFGLTPLFGWINGPAGREVALTLDDGSRRVLRLKDYY